jgi:aspartate-semialdehyde dehydrogenase
MTEKIPVAVLGATGTVGQRFIDLLADHPWFEIASITGSKRSEGQAYGEAVRWLLPGEIPPTLREMQVSPSDGELDGAQLVFSALPAQVAKDAEPRLAAEGYIVCSNASAHRMGSDIPLLIPEVNAKHLALVDRQRGQRGWSGLIVTSPNCAATGIVFPLKALDDAFGVSHVHAVTMQAISGAGYPGISSIEQYDNIVPHIHGEEVKIEQETRKLLGKLNEEEIEPSDIEVSAQANRVPVLDGHMAALSVGLKNIPSLKEVEATLASFQGLDELPSAPAHPMIVRSEENRPQPRLDRDAQDGMAISVGRLQPCSVLDFRMVSLVHNTLRGAASGALMNAELLVVEGYLGEAAKQMAFA